MNRRNFRLISLSPAALTLIALAAAAPAGAEERASLGGMKDRLHLDAGGLTYKTLNGESGAGAGVGIDYLHRTDMRRSSEYRRTAITADVGVGRSDSSETSRLLGTAKARTEYMFKGIDGAIGFNVEARGQNLPHLSTIGGGMGLTLGLGHSRASTENASSGVIRILPLYSYARDRVSGTNAVSYALALDSEVNIANLVALMGGVEARYLASNAGNRGAAATSSTNATIGAKVRLPQIKSLGVNPYLKAQAVFDSSGMETKSTIDHGNGNTEILRDDRTVGSSRIFNVSLGGTMK